MAGLRIGGLSSGMDIDSIIEKMMSAQRAPLDKLQQQKQTYEWQRDAFRTMNKNAKALSDYMFDNLTLKSSLIKKAVTTTNDAVTATANSTATGTLQISAVKQLATSATIKSNSFGTNVSKDTKLSDANPNLAGTEELKLKVLKDNGKLDDVTIKLAEDETIDSFVNKLNKSETGLTAYFDEKSGHLSISTKATGIGSVEVKREVIVNNITEEVTDSYESSMFVEDSASKDFFASLGFNASGNLSEGGPSVITEAKNAVFTYNGLDLERNSNTFTLNGYNITLNKTYNTDNSASPITLKATTDVDHFINKVEEFVNKYNEFIKSTHGAITETKNRKYTPLTEAQKKEMSEDEIEKWEKTAKSGVIRGDSTVASGLQNLRSIIYSNAGSSGKKYDTLSEIGITTTKTYNDGGLIELNKDKLREALLADEEAVFKVFSNDTEGEPKGVINQMRDSLTKFQSSIEVKAGKDSAANNTFTIGRNMDNVDKRIKTWEDKLKMIEDRYWNQFTAMEKAINKANEQSSTLFGSTMQ